MFRRPAALICAGFLMAGIAIGTVLDSWSFVKDLRANALDPSAADRLYSELDAEANPLLAGSRAMAKIAALATPSVVHIKSNRENDRSGRVEETGSGVVVSNPRTSDVFIVTNRHVVADADNDDISIQLYDGRVIHPTQVLADTASDVALLKTNERDLSALRWGNSDEVGIGDIVLAVGSPFGLSHSVTFGIISAKGRRSLRLGGPSEVINQDFLQTDAAINPGNSGGPLIDLHGRVIGINTAIASNSGGNDGIGFSIPSNLVRRIVDELLANGSVRRAFLGVKLDSSFGEEVARRLQLSRIRGARVVEVYPDTPAARARLQFDDVVTHFEGVPIYDENHLINLVSLAPIGKKVRLTVIREGREVSVEVLLTDRPAAP
jgi:serine protease Do